jgi:ABC-2 type transport system ATP-binding protein
MIEVNHISKWFGPRQVLKDISFYVEKGEILGFLGLNGAGKTTTMRIVTGFLPPTKGTVQICGYNIRKNPLLVKQRLGYFPEHNPLYQEMSVESYLRFVARIKEVGSKEQTKRLNTAIAQCGLEDVRRRLIKRLSKGYRQRVGLAQTLINDPEVLVLDEPTIGLDPKQNYEIRKLIKDLAPKKTVILSTHLLLEVSMVCSRVLIINNGQVVAEDSLKRLTAQQGYIEILVDASKQDLINLLKDIPQIKKIEAKEEAKLSKVYIQFDPKEDIRAKLSRLIIEQGWQLLELIPRRPSLEEIFVKLVSKEAN